MSVPFDPANGLIVVSARLTGPTGSTVARLALDTGATESVISVAPLVFIGYGLDFFRGKVLTLDFAKGKVSLTP